MRASLIMVKRMHDQFLRLALEQAWLGRGFCAPNPSVGAVAVQNGEIIAQAWHQSAGTPHAEQLVLSQLRKGLSDVTLYVTLEPCNHWGKTPPCVDGIIEYGIRRVVYAYSDPNPVVAANNTPSLLSQHGIETIYYPTTEITEFYNSYRRWILTKKPFVTAKIAQTFDGKIGVTRAARTILSNSQCAEFTHQRRYYADLILTTARTVNLDNPMLNVRLNGVETKKDIAIIDRKGLLNPAAKVINTARQCHIYHDEHCVIEKPIANCLYHPVPSVNGKLQLTAIIEDLGKLGYHDVWVEAGGELFTALHKEKLVQKSYLYLVPKILGDQAVPAYHSDIFTQDFDIKWESMGNNMIASVVWKGSLEEGCSLA